MGSGTYGIGHEAEDAACEALEAEGFSILARNFRVSRFCEADVIALDGDVLVAVEVKKISGGFDVSEAVRKIDVRKKAKVRAALEAYAAANSRSEVPMRVDAFFVMDGRKVHYKGI